MSYKVDLRACFMLLALSITIVLGFSNTSRYVDMCQLSPVLQFALQEVLHPLVPLVEVTVTSSSLGLHSTVSSIEVNGLSAHRTSQATHRHFPRTQAGARAGLWTLEACSMNKRSWNLNEHCKNLSSFCFLHGRIQVWLLFFITLHFRTLNCLTLACSAILNMWFDEWEKNQLLDSLHMLLYGKTIVCGMNKWKSMH